MKICRRDNGIGLIRLALWTKVLHMNRVSCRGNFRRLLERHSDVMPCTVVASSSLRDFNQHLRLTTSLLAFVELVWPRPFRWKLCEIGF
jgi:hypothetical protein